MSLTPEKLDAKFGMEDLEKEAMLLSTKSRVVRAGFLKELKKKADESQDFNDLANYRLFAHLVRVFAKD